MLLNSFWSNTEFLYTTQNGCNWPKSATLVDLRMRTTPRCRSSASRYWSWLIMTSPGAQADGSSIIRARSDLHRRSWCLLHMRQLTVHERQGHEWDEIWITLNTTGDRNSHVYLQLLEVYCNPRNWRSQRNHMKLWIVGGLYKYCLFDFFKTSIIGYSVFDFFHLIDWIFL